MEVFIRFMGSPDCEDFKMLWRKLILEVLDSHLFFGVFGAWMTLKKPEIDKTLRNGLSMSEADPINHK